MSNQTRVYVGGVSSSADEKDVEELFKEYGPLKYCKLRNGGNAFLEFEDSKAAADAIQDKNGIEFKGQKIKVEYARNNRDRDNGHRGDRGDRGGDRRRDHSRDRERDSRPSPNDRCYVCNEYGHWASKCPKGDGKGVSSGSCFKCGKKGHIARKCRGGRRSDSRGRSRSRSYSRSRSPRRSRSGDRRRRNDDRRRRHSSSRSRSYSRSRSDSRRRGGKRSYSRGSSRSR